ncbi:glycosyltransferase [Sphingomonas daechungensis]|uniref:glycosyltransferase n=1 Tax=Sphingomonas daechungensis TaxID=1176646 RepID=UPI003784F739
MKIVHVLPSLARGGGERLAIELANRQVESGHEVTLVIGSLLPSDMVHDGLDPRVSTHFITSDRGRMRYRAMLPWLWRRRDWLGSQDVLHCHLTYGALFGAAFRKISRSRRPAIVETYHAVGMPIPKWLKRLHARLARDWDGIALMVDDPDWRNFASSNPGIEFRVIPAGVDAPEVPANARLNAYRRSLGISDGTKVVTTIGRLVAERRPRSYVPVFAEVAETIGSDVAFLMGGDGPERSMIEADAKAAGISERLHMAGIITDMAEPLAISDLYITANVGPVPGVAGLQAIAVGVPVIAIQLSDVYPSPANDWIWSSKDPQEIADKAVALLRSPSEAKALAQRQSEHLQAHHSAAAMAAAYDDFYRDAAARLRSA